MLGGSQSLPGQGGEKENPTPAETQTASHPPRGQFLYWLSYPGSS